MSDTMRHKRPHLRCGLCDMEIEDGERTTYVDDERCHSECADHYHAADAGIDPYRGTVAPRFYLHDEWDENELEEAA